MKVLVICINSKKVADPHNSFLLQNKGYSHMAGDTYVFEHRPVHIGWHTHDERRVLAYACTSFSVENKTYVGDQTGRIEYTCIL